MNDNTQQRTDVATRKTFSAFIGGDGIKTKINQIIGGKKGDGFVTAIVSAVSNNPTLAECDNNTILSAGLQGAALDLSPSPSLGHFYMVPFDDRKNQRKVAQFQIGYKGYIQLAIRSGQYRRINVIALKEGELISYNRLTEEIFTKLIEDDEIRDSMETTGYYAMFELTNGFVKTMYWSRAKMERHADKYSQAFNLSVFNKIVSGEIHQSDLWKREYSSFWYKDFDGMAYKTMLRQLLGKWGVMSIEMQRAFESDMGVIDGEGKANYVDNPEEGITIEQEAERQELRKSDKPACSDEQFEKSFPSWKKAVESGKSPDDVIKTAESKYVLTDEQKSKIRGASTGEMSEDEIAAARQREMAEAAQ